MTRKIKKLLIFGIVFIVAFILLNVGLILLKVDLIGFYTMPQMILVEFLLTIIGLIFLCYKVGGKK